MSEILQSPSFTWQAYEFEYIEKTPDWFWIVGLGGTLIGITSYISGNWSFAVLVVLSTVILMVISRRRPHILDIALDPTHLAVADRTYKLSKFDQYNIDIERSVLILHASAQGYRPVTVVPISDSTPLEKVATMLEQANLEQNEDLREPLLEIIVHRLGF